MPVVSFTRTESFSAAHRLHNPSLSEEENRELFGKCNHPAGHGHNYRVDVTVKGEIDARTGMVVDAGKLSKVIWQEALVLLDHRNIDVDIEWFRSGGKPSTAENIAIFIWEMLRRHLPSLYSVRVQETDHNAAEYFGK